MITKDMVPRIEGMKPRIEGMKTRIECEGEELKLLKRSSLVEADYQARCQHMRAAQQGAMSDQFRMQRAYARQSGSPYSGLSGILGGLAATPAAKSIWDD